MIKPSSNKKPTVCFKLQCHQPLAQTHLLNHDGPRPHPVLIQLIGCTKSFVSLPLTCRVGGFCHHRFSHYYDIYGVPTDRGSYRYHNISNDSVWLFINCQWDSDNHKMQRTQDSFFSNCCRAKYLNFVIFNRHGNHAIPWPLWSINLF